MKRQFVSSILILTWVLYLSNIQLLITNSQASDKVNIAVMDLKGSDISEMEATTVTELLRTELINTGYFNVVEKANMDKVLQESGFQQSGCTTEECAIQIGKILNVRKMIVGSVLKSLGTYIINIRFIDVEKGVAEFAVKVTAKPTSEGLISASQVLSTSILKISQEGIQKVDISKQGEKKPLMALQHFIKPFILRRLKENIALELLQGKFPLYI